MDVSLAMPGFAGFSRRIGRIMNQRGGLWAGIVAVLSGIVVIVLAVLFSALFLGLFLAIGVAVMVRAWLLGRSSRRAQPEVIEAEYTVIDSDDSPGRRSGP
jgi:hypothetical protein